MRGGFAASLVLGLALAAGHADAAREPLSRDQFRCLGDTIFFNECSGKAERLISWNAGEDFPSLGIGHFIWFPAGVRSPFVETFPGLLEHYEQSKILLPAWIRALPDRHAPWAKREEFLRDRGSARVKELERFLLDTRELQARHIFSRASEMQPRLLKHADPASRAAIGARFRMLESSYQGVFAITDYVNFKGEGTEERERYAGSGWGLLQVLENMRDAADPADAVAAFSESAAEVLERRVRNAPAGRDETRWLPGWTNRVRRYPALSC